MTAPECANPLFPVVSSTQYLSCVVPSLQSCGFPSCCKWSLVLLICSTVMIGSAKCQEQVIADIAGMGYDLFGPRAKSTCAALIFGSISSFGINYNCNAVMRSQL
ncbi:hypothetical protein RHMOL_Rhmol06G0033300 [Rhododendron molle]|uniref:Uncharacterized protein n=1 Tax=Rhododendron molle TaxID=49168 RepID=A0ACC0N8N9_RHOML|nr:hypothetical protein RHMOL_Rhmol06G0033300 [Rhododendron molle]